jgi:hypothetical protein
MLDVEFLFNPVSAPHIIYRYRTNAMRLPMRKMAESFASDLNLPFKRLSPDDVVFHTGLLASPSYLFCEAGPEHGSMIEELERLAGTERSFLAVPESSQTFSDPSWPEISRCFLVLEEPLIDAQTIGPLLRYVATATDLRPDPMPRPTDVHAAAASRGVQTLADFAPFFDEYILLGGQAAGSETGTYRLPPLAGPLRAFIAEPTEVTIRNLVGSALGRNATVEGLIEDLIGTTRRLVSRLTAARPSVQQLLRWAILLFARGDDLERARQISFGPWRGGPDLRLSVLTELIQEYRLGVAGTFNVTELLPRLASRLAKGRLADGRKAELTVKYREALRLLASRLGPSEVSRQIGAVLDADVAAQQALKVRPTASFQYTPTTFDAFARYPQAVRRLTHLNAGTVSGEAFLFVGSSTSERAGLAKVQANAIACTDRKAGSPCLECEGCKDFGRGQGVAYANLYGAPATRQLNLIEAIRKAITGQSLFGKLTVLIEGVDQVFEGALDKLLKAIEDAPQGANIILTADRLPGVPAALRSRSLTFKLR